MRSVPSELLEKLHKNIQTKGSQAQPKMNVAVARAKTTVTDSSYWTVEKIREKTGLGDIAVAARRYSKHYGRPDRLYEIHVDNGQVKTALREYPDLTKAGWQDQFTLGPGTDVAIAFDGEWELYRKVWRQRTHENPWIFWVDDLGVLWGQLWDDETTLVELATGVSKVTAIRGWKELDNGLNDQGIVVAFVKTDGTVWYRNYCIQVDLTYIWEAQGQVTGFTGTATNVGLFLTNDYRLGFLVENTLGKIWWLVTGRVWVGMAIERDNLSANFTDITIDVIPITYYETQTTEYLTSSISEIDFQVCPATFDMAQVTITQAKRVSEHQIRLTFSHNILYANLSSNNFYVENKTVDYVSYGLTTKDIVINVIESLPSVGVFNIQHTSGILRVDVTDICKPLLNTFSVVATGDPPITEENLQITLDNVTFTVLPVNYRYSKSRDENIKVTLMDVSFVVTKVGNNPL